MSARDRNRVAWAPVVLAAWVGACGAPSGPQGAREPRAGQAGAAGLEAAPRPLASVHAVDAGLRVDVVGVARPARDVVQVDLVVYNPSGAPVDLASSFAPGLDRSAFVAESGQVKTHVLSDDAGEPQCSTVDGAGLAPGAQRPLFMRFGALSRDAYRGTITIPGLPEMGGVAVPPVP